jgi:hypothetical protein
MAETEKAEMPNGNAIAFWHRISSPSGPTVARPSVDHIPAGGFVLRRNSSVGHCAS